MTALPASAAQLRSLPKLELHLHLEGCIEPARIERLAAEVGESPPRPFDLLFQAPSLTEFLETLDWICGLVRTPEAAQEIAEDFLRYAETQGICYAELIVNPTHWSGLPVDVLFGALAETFEAGEAAGRPEVYLLPSLLRQQSETEALKLVDWMGASGLKRLRGLSVDGDQSRAHDSSQQLAPAFRRARDLGFPGTAHAGESSGPEGVLAALDLLCVSRIDHGVRAVEDPALVARLARERVPLNVCVSSNCVRLYESVQAHPLESLRTAGVACTLNTDDPVVLATSLCDELYTVATGLGWSLADLVSVQQVAIDAAFCPLQRKHELRAQLNAYRQEPPP